MRKSLFLALIAATLLMSANDVFAQRLFRRGGLGIGVGSGYYGSGYYGSGYYGSGYYGSPYNGGGGYYGSSFYGSPYYSGYGTPYYSGYNGSYGAPYYSNSMPYVGSSSTYYATPTVTQSSYADPNSATLTVYLPSADAQVWFDDAATTQRGMERVFQTPSLQRAGTYTVKASWNSNGRNVNQTRTVTVQPGQSMSVDFRTPPAENVTAPKTS